MMTTNTQVEVARITEHYPQGMIAEEAIGYILHSYRIENAYAQWIAFNGIEPVLTPTQLALEEDGET